MFNHEMMLRRKLEERELQQAIDFQDRRLMNLQIADMKNHQLQRSLSLGVGVHAGIHSPTQMNQNFKCMGPTYFSLHFYPVLLISYVKVSDLKFLITLGRHIFCFLKCNHLST